MTMTGNAASKPIRRHARLVATPASNGTAIPATRPIHPCHPNPDSSHGMLANMTIETMNAPIPASAE